MNYIYTAETEVVRQERQRRVAPEEAERYARELFEREEKRLERTEEPIIVEEIANLFPEPEPVIEPVIEPEEEQEQEEEEEEQEEEEQEQQPQPIVTEPEQHPRNAFVEQVKEEVQNMTTPEMENRIEEIQKDITSIQNQKKLVKRRQRDVIMASNQIPSSNEIKTIVANDIADMTPAEIKNEGGLQNAIYNSLSFMGKIAATTGKLAVRGVAVTGKLAARGIAATVSHLAEGYRIQAANATPQGAALEQVRQEFFEFVPKRIIFYVQFFKMTAEQAYAMAIHEYNHMNQNNVPSVVTNTDTQEVEWPIPLAIAYKENYGETPRAEMFIWEGFIREGATEALHGFLNLAGNTATAAAMLPLEIVRDIWRREWEQLHEPEQPSFMQQAVERVGEHVIQEYTIPAAQAIVTGVTALGSRLRLFIQNQLDNIRTVVNEQENRIINANQEAINNVRQYQQDDIDARNEARLRNDMEEVRQINQVIDIRRRLIFELNKEDAEIREEMNQLKIQINRYTNVFDRIRKEIDYYEQRGDTAAVEALDRRMEELSQEADQLLFRFRDLDDLLEQGDIGNIKKQ